MCAETPDYKDTLNLPKTDFPMRAGLPKREPDWLARWEKMGIYDRLREKTGRKPYILHDGPPYANGNLHIGHALNKILKDMVVRCHQMMGHDALYVPGWDLVYRNPHLDITLSSSFLNTTPSTARPIPMITSIMAIT